MLSPTSTCCARPSLPTWYAQEARNAPVQAAARARPCCMFVTCVGRQGRQAGQAGGGGAVALEERSQRLWFDFAHSRQTVSLLRFLHHPTTPHAEHPPPPYTPPTPCTPHTPHAAHAARTTATAALRTHPVRGMQCHVSPRPDDVGDCNHKRQRRAAVDPVHAVTQRKPLEEVGKPPAKKQSKGRAHRGTARARQAATPVDQPQRYSNAG